MPWRLGIDLGTNSLGWWAFSVVRQGNRWHVCDSLDGGAYVFPDGREPARNGRVGDSNAVNRRLARSMRRNRDRRKTRLRAFMHDLVEMGLMPDSCQERDELFQTPKKSEDPDRYNPYRLRAEALNRKLEPYELGRALFHLGLRRGFKSNRVEQKDDEGGKLKEKMDELSGALNGRTLGQFQWERFQEEKKRQKSGENPSGVRFRGEGKFYPDRAMYKAEFDAIREYQKSHHDLRSEDWDRLRDCILFQRPLRPMERGRCEFFPDKLRHWKDTPIGHDFRIYQELSNLRWIDTNLTPHELSAEQREAVLHLLLTRKSEVKFEFLLKQKKNGLLLFPDCMRFNLEGEKRKGLKNHAIGVKLSGIPVLVPLWQRRCSDKGDDGLLDDIFETLHQEADPESLRTRLAENFKLDNEAIQALSDLRLSRETASVSRRAMDGIVEGMREQGLPYLEAVEELKGDDGDALHHSHRPGSKDREMLPYYGEVLRGSMLGADPTKDPESLPEKHFGKIGNPTVHVALNSLRRVVNALIGRFGERPVEIHVELSRDLKRPRKQRDEKPPSRLETSGKMTASEWNSGNAASPIPRRAKSRKSSCGRNSAKISSHGAARFPEN